MDGEIETFWDASIRADGAKGWDLVAHHPHGDQLKKGEFFDGFWIDEGDLAREQLVEDDPHRVDICAVIEVCGVGDLFGGDIKGSAKETLCFVSACGSRAVKGLCDTKVEDFDKVVTAAVMDQEDVVGLEIAVDDVFFVGGLHRIAKLCKHIQTPCDGRKMLAICKSIRQRNTFQKLHHIEVSEAGDLTEIIEYTDDMGIALRERRCGLNLAQKAVFHPGLFHDFGLHDLDDALGVSVHGEVHRTIHHPEPTFSKHFEQPILPCNGHERKLAKQTKAKIGFHREVRRKILFASRAERCLCGGHRHRIAL